MTPQRILMDGEGGINAEVGIPHRFVLGMRVDQTSYAHASDCIIGWARAGQSRTVCIANVHMVMEAHDSPAYRRIINGADLVTPDGTPVAWMLRASGAKGQGRVYGPDLMLHVCRQAELNDVPVGFIGGKPEVLRRLVRNISARFPDLQIVFKHSPPFRAASDAEGRRVQEEIKASGAAILFVGLGCPKQEIWMASHQGRIPAVMLGVGAAFDFHAGTLKQAPAFLQRAGLEWLFRLTMEPRRLWRRYLRNNPRFMVLALAQLAGFIPSAGAAGHRQGPAS